MRIGLGELGRGRKIDALAGQRIDHLGSILADDEPQYAGKIAERALVLPVWPHAVKRQLFNQVERLQDLAAAEAARPRNRNSMIKEYGFERLFPDRLVALHVLDCGLATFALDHVDELPSPGAAVHIPGASLGNGTKRLRQFRLNEPIADLRSFSARLPHEFLSLLRPGKMLSAGLEKPREGRSHGESIFRVPDGWHQQSEKASRPKRACRASMPAMKPGTRVLRPCAVAAGGSPKPTPRPTPPIDRSQVGMLLGSVSGDTYSNRR